MLVVRQQGRSHEQAMNPNLECYLKSYRRRWGLTQTELAALLGFQTGAVVSRLERALRHPSLETAYAFEIILGTPPSELFPGLHVRVKREVIARSRTLYDELQGDPSNAAQLKLDFFEEIFARWEERPRLQRT
jgi:transcriptional regulator with XRE-family HTH domain